jgi:2-polyprenyl-3-methyl-5-hydroxy-6-metoxy-1,4-benzoquinol methylase
LDTQLLENHKKYLERVSFYKKFDYDIEQERNFIFEKSGPIWGNILEVGTGKGYFTLQLARKGYSFTSVDISAEEQNFARLNIQYFGLENRVIFKMDDAEKLSSKDGSFDVVFSIHLIHHLKNPSKAMDEFTRVVKPKCKIVLSDFNEEGFKMMAKIHATEGREHDAGKITLDEIACYLENKGFSIRKHQSKFQDVVIVNH